MWQLRGPLHPVCNKFGSIHFGSTLSGSFRAFFSSVHCLLFNGRGGAGTSLGTP